jgi:hypothetical protein
VFGHASGHFAFYLTLVPMACIVVTLLLFRRAVEGTAAATVVEAPLEGSVR